MKVGKEEIVGMLAAVEMWARRDHKAEDEMWTSWMNNIAARVSKIDGVTTAVRQPRGLSNHSPGISINWDAAKLGITGQEVSRILDSTEPRILLGGGGGGCGGRGGRTAGQNGRPLCSPLRRGRSRRDCVGWCSAEIGSRGASA
jgi:L-seryl-tRNA(Ser) seleniumtransferase